MKNFSLAVVVIALAAAFANTPAAMADTFNYTFTVGTTTATGTLTGTEFAPGKFDIESGTISLVGGPVVGSGALNPNPNGPGGLYTYQNPPNSGGANYTIDNVLTPGSNPQLDGYGLLFTVDGVPVNLWGNSPNNYELFEGAYLFDAAGGSFITPEPSTLLLLGTGLFLLAFVVFRKDLVSGLVLQS